MPSTVKTRVSRPHGLRTRQRILDAAFECLVELGYGGTTTLAVQARAGVTRGSLLHHFPSRDEMLVAATVHLAEKMFAETMERLDTKTGDGNRIDAFVEAMWEGFQGPLFNAATELWVAARTDPNLRHVVDREERQFARKIREGYAKVFAPYSEHPRFAEVFDLLLNSMRGFAMTHNFFQSDRADTIRLESWKRLTHELLE